MIELMLDIPTDLKIIIGSGIICCLIFYFKENKNE